MSAGSKHTHGKFSGKKKGQQKVHWQEALGSLLFFTLLRLLLDEYDQLLALGIFGENSTQLYGSEALLMTVMGHVE